LVGLSPDDVLRQLQAFKSGDRHGEQSVLMKPVIDGLTPVDMVNIAAYVGTLKPE
jgi:cytochrome c553